MKMKLEHFVRSPFNYDRAEASRQSGISTDGMPSMAIQSEKDNCDINIIMKRFNVTKQLPPGSVRMPTYGDFSQVGDFHTAMQVVRQAEEAFAQMPSELRSKFGNDPGAFVAFCSEETEDGELVNIEAMRKLGLAVPKEPDIIKESVIPQVSKEINDGVPAK